MSAEVLSLPPGEVLLDGRVCDAAGVVRCWAAGLHVHGATPGGGLVVWYETAMERLLRPTS